MGCGLDAAQAAVMQINRPTQVFIVDDSVSIRTRLVQMVARMDDASVVGEAASASEAIAGILRLRPDSVLLDLNLMGSTGLDVMRKVVPHAPEIAFVVLTNHFESQYRDASFEAGARYFLDKSRDLDKVPGVIAEIAGTRH
jgi:two-component system, NarL family, response regulator DevR